MPFKIPKDIEKKLKTKYPNLNIQEFVHDLFDAVIQKTFQHGSCSVRELGRFVAFQTYSSKLERNIVRFKFRPALSLTNKIKKDPYLLSTLPIQSKHEFGEDHEKNCQPHREKRNHNEEAIREAKKHEKEGTQEELVRSEVKQILNDNEED